MSSAADLALVVNRQGIIEELTIGESIQPHAGWTGLVGKRWSDTIAQDSQSKVEDLLREARERGLTRSREVNQRADGAGEFPFKVSGVLLDADERVAVLGHDLRPISRMQQDMIAAQQAMDREFARMRQADTRYRVLFQVSSEAVVVADAANLKVTEVNPAAAALIEEAPSALRGRPLTELFEAQGWPVVQALIAATEAGGRTGDARALLRDGLREVVVSASLFRQAGTSALLLRLRAGGLSPRRSEARAARMLSVIDALPDGFVIADEDLRILSANDSFCEMVQQANENQVVGQSLERWLGRPGVDVNIMLANLREHGSVRNFATIVRGDFGAQQEAVVSAVSALDGKTPCLGFTIRTVAARIPATGGTNLPAARSVDQLRELVGRVPLKEIVRESADLIERLCIQAALDVSDNNRALAAQLLGLSRQGLYSKLRRYGIGDLEPGAT